MKQSQAQHAGQEQQHVLFTPGHSVLSRRFPILLPVILFGSAVALLATSLLLDDRPFPVLGFLGISPVSFCLAIACALAITAVLLGIALLAERMDRYSTQPVMVTKE
uniref:Uncharacterized protein n=1 Tax=Thermosporothrix sp. COM3 TaxID=2490863 RepID=A0A455SPD3_9CHLR|nr:hypothetical protein KTC_35900 [Thermosporothrix sp. COM3]